MLWLITGAGGMAGSDLRDALIARGERVAALSRRELDVTDASAVRASVAEHRPDVIVNCAAYTRVDLAETDESAANAINGSAVELLAHAANEVDALLVQISSDFVFDGRASSPYEVDAATAPLSAYGRSKLLGEVAAAQARRHLIVRTSWLFGTRGPSFVEAIRNQIAKGTDPLRVVDDQRGRPTYTPHLAEAIIRLVGAGTAARDAAAPAGGTPAPPAIVHYGDAPDCTWYDFACAIVEELGAGVTVKPVSTDEFPRPAPRPAYSVLSTTRYEQLTGVTPASWREGLRQYLKTRT